MELILQILLTRVLVLLPTEFHPQLLFLNHHLLINGGLHVTFRLHLLLLNNRLPLYSKLLLLWHMLLPNKLLRLQHILLPLHPHQFIISRLQVKCPFNQQRGNLSRSQSSLLNPQEEMLRSTMRSVLLTVTLIPPPLTTRLLLTP